SPELYQQWGIRPPKGVLLYGPLGTGKSKLARALATSAGAIFYHVKLFNLTSKFGANTGELLQEILRIAMGEGKAVLFLDETEALSLEHLLPPPLRARRLPQGAADDGRHERRRHHRDPEPRARGEGPPGGRGRSGLARQHAGSAGGHRPLQARAQRGREDPLRPVPVIATTP